MSENFPDVLTKANAVLAELAAYTKLEDQYAFVECATFADVIKHKGWGDQAHWHFVDTPFLDGVDYDINPNEYNVTWEISELTYALKYAKPEAADSFTDVSYALGDSMNLRLLIHYIGDVHQPLHATTRYTEDLPNGDRGGNSVHLAAHDDIKNLHALWDSVVTKYAGGDLTLPLSSDDWSTVGGYATEIRNNYPRTSFKTVGGKPADWANESFEISKTFVYDGVTDGGWVSDEYITKGQVIAEKRLALAGYRLADTLSTMWGGSWSEEELLE